MLCLLATLRSGAAYLPLDPRQPAARLRGILDDARARVLIGPADLCEGLGGRALAADILGDPAATDEADDTPHADAGPEDPAYVIYTSGSTGAPKGVIVPHAAIVNRLEWMRAHYAIGPADRILQKTPATFDVSVWELFLPFLSGARLVIAPPGARTSHHRAAFRAVHAGRRPGRARRARPGGPLGVLQRRGPARRPARPIPPHDPGGTAQSVRPDRGRRGRVVLASRRG